MDGGVLKKPAAQQIPEPALLLTPLAQGRQSLADMEPERLLKVLSGQAVHVAVPKEAAYLPAKHVVQPLLPE